MSGPCAKLIVMSCLILPDGSYYFGENKCDSPQTICPRDTAGYKTGEGYYLCKDVCKQPFHAELDAINEAVMDHKDVHNGIMFVWGHTYICDHCQQAMRKHGIRKAYVCKEVF